MPHSRHAQALRHNPGMGTAGTIGRAVFELTGDEQHALVQSLEAELEDVL